MRGKSLDFSQVFDIRAMRIIVSNVADCYEALSWVHYSFLRSPPKFDDHIAKPKPNGYQSLHTVVRDDAGRPIEIQIRTQAMHDHAEHGVAAHWAYKEAGAKGYVGQRQQRLRRQNCSVAAALGVGARDVDRGCRARRICRKTGADPSAEETALFDDRIYVLTPNAAIVELAQRCDTHRLCLYRAHQLGPQMQRCQSRWRDDSFEHAPAKRTDRGNHHREGRRPFAGLDEHRAGFFGQSPCASQSPCLVQCTNHAREHRKGA